MSMRLIMHKYALQKPHRERYVVRASTPDEIDRNHPPISDR